MTTRKKSSAIKKGHKGSAGQAEGVPSKLFKRRAIARTLAGARREGTETAFEAELISLVLDAKELDPVTHFNTVGFLAVLYCKIKDLDGTQRQALFSDPRLARVLYPHIKNAFPAEAAEAFNVYFQSVHDTAPHILDRLVRESGGEGGKS